MMQMDGSIAERIREESLRAKAIAIEKYNAGDLVGAKEFALKAQELNPALNGLLRLNAVLDVQMGFGKKINAQVEDWYAVLSVDPTADLETIQERYKKLSLDILLDNENSVCSIDEANRLLADAWKYLCNKESRQRYDKIRQLHLSLQNQDASSSASNSSSADGGSFWTTCHACSMHYEYLGRYKDHWIMCAQCRKPFKAIEYPAPSRMTCDNPWSYAKQQEELMIERASQVPSLPYNPVVLSEAPEPVFTSQRPFEEVITVPDPDFYDFDEDQTEASFDCS